VPQRVKIAFISFIKYQCNWNSMMIFVFPHDGKPDKIIVCVLGTIDCIDH
jgi:hypothetical protein